MEKTPHPAMPAIALSDWPQRSGPAAVRVPFRRRACIPAWPILPTCFSRLPLLLLALFLLTPRGASAAGYGGEPLDFFRENQPQVYEFALKQSRDLYRTLRNQGFPYPLEAAAVVFPELLRYSTFQDEIESLANEILATASEESDGFSIGLMQMKPLFASTVEEIVSADPGLTKRYPSIALAGDRSTAAARRERILRLRETEFQTEYLKAFVEYEVRVLRLVGEDRECRIKYLSAAYNLGIRESREPLERAFGQECFPSGRRRLYFNYQKICLAAAGEILGP